MDETPEEAEASGAAEAAAEAAARAQLRRALLLFPMALEPLLTTGGDRNAAAMVGGPRRPNARRSLMASFALIL